MPAGHLVKAAEAAARGSVEEALMWALLSVAEDVAQIRRDLHWQRTQGGRRG
jgi:phosphoglycerate dehydrogenase-like enzyme